jgi:hypothetical protein
LPRSAGAGGNVAAADPTVYANGTPLARNAQGTVFFRDFQPGTYRLRVQPYGTPANLVDTLQLAPGTQAYAQVQAVPNWELGSTAGGASRPPEATRSCRKQHRNDSKTS